MGCKSSKARSWSQTSSIHSTASSSSSSSSSSNMWGGLYQSPFDQESQNYVPPQQSYTQQYYALAQDYGSQNYGVGAEDFDHRRRLDKRYSRIADNFNSLEQGTSYVVDCSHGKQLWNCEKRSMNHYGLKGETTVIWSSD